MEIYQPVADSYAAFADEAADSPCFRAWALGVAGDLDVQARIAELPAVKQQPNLVFAAARWHGVPAPGPYDGLREALLGPQWEPIRAEVMARSTQTNEVGRLATLVPVLAQLAERAERPLALVEVGASAGLCLYPDRWGYEWTSADGDTVAVGPVERVLPCRVQGRPPLPDGPPEVAWRAGLELNPLDVADADAMRWLENLVWPEQEERRERLRTAVAVARAEPPSLRRGDLRTDLPDLLDELPGDALPVVFHSAVVAYLAPQDRAGFDALMRGLVAEGRCRWVSNEGPAVLASVTATAPPPPQGTRPFVLGVDGRAVAFTHGHGTWLHWFA